MKKKNQEQMSTRQLIGVTEITEYSLKTASSEAAFFSIKPCNISILSEESLSGKIYSLMSVLKGIAEIEFLCLNSRESFEGNKSFLRSRIAARKDEQVAAAFRLQDQLLQAGGVIADDMLVHHADTQLGQLAA